MDNIKELEPGLNKHGTRKLDETRALSLIDQPDSDHQTSDEEKGAYQNNENATEVTEDFTTSISYH